MRARNDLKELTSYTLSSIGISKGNVTVRVFFKSTDSPVPYLSQETTKENVPINHKTNNSVSEISQSKINTSVSAEIQTTAQENKIIPTITENITSNKPTKETADISRNIKVFKAPPAGYQKSHQSIIIVIYIYILVDLPESFYILSPQELKFFWSMQHSNTKKLLEGGSLMTKKMRDSEIEKKLKKHPKVLFLLIKFLNRL